MESASMAALSTHRARNRASAKSALVLLVLTISAFLAPAKDLLLKTEANVMVEATFRAAHAHPDPFNTVTLDVIFQDPNGQESRVPGFWAGTNVWKVRYASPVQGRHRFRSECSDAADPGLHGINGEVVVRPYKGTNPFYLHGPIQVSSNRRYFQHADGTPFFWMGDTWWMGLCSRIHWPGEFKRLTADRRKKGFNVIQIIAGLYPDMPAFDPRGANEAGFPWETNYSSIRPEYFAAADERLKHLAAEGFAPCIVGAWGYFLPWMGVEKARQHWRYLIARYGALPVVWCVAGEANLPWYHVKGFPNHALDQARDWTELMHFVRATDPFHHPITVHPSGKGRASSRTVVANDPAALDFDMLQTPHGRREAVEETVDTVRRSYADSPTMPVIDGEAAYEMLKVGTNTVPTEWTRRMFWLCLLDGAAGHTYGASGIWQCNRRDQPYGKSPLDSDYGPTTWDEAMRLPGSQQVGLGKRLFEQYQWQKFEPHPEWAEFAVKSADPSNEGVYAPQSAGIPGTVRITYVPEAEPIVLKGLGPGSSYTAWYFDPVSGKRTRLPSVRADGSGSWTCAPPPGKDHDWVLILESEPRTKPRS